MEDCIDLQLVTGLEFNLQPVTLQGRSSEIAFKPYLLPTSTCAIDDLEADAPRVFLLQAFENPGPTHPPLTLPEDAEVLHLLDGAALYARLRPSEIGERLSNWQLRAALPLHPALKMRGDEVPQAKEFPLEAEVEISGYGDAANVFQKFNSLSCGSPTEPLLSCGPPTQPILLAQPIVPKCICAAGVCRRELGLASRARVRWGTLSDYATVLACEGAEFENRLPEAFVRNAMTSRIIQSNTESGGTPPPRPLYKAGLSGRGETIGIIDDLVDPDHCFFAPLTSSPRCNSCRVIRSYESSLGVPPSVDAQQHGTAVAGIAAGFNPRNPDALSHGQASGAALSIAYLGDVAGWGKVSGALYDYLAYMASDCGGGAKILNLSWGDDCETSYGWWSQDVDRFLWEDEYAVVVVAARNSEPDEAGGPCGPKTKKEDRQTVASPDNAKNAITVGASRQALAKEQKGSGPTRGTADGRLKPDLMAPGCWVRSAVAGTACDVATAHASVHSHHHTNINSNHDTNVNCATSWAAPAVAGAAAMVREYFTQGYFPSGKRTKTDVDRGDSCLPSGALLKAVLLNSTEDMTEVPAGNTPFPNFEEGWGRVHLDKSLYFKDEAERRELAVWDTFHAKGLKLYEERTFEIKVKAGTELRITLVWAQPPVFGVRPEDFNRLSLKVVDDAGKEYPLLPSKTYDNVLQVRVASPPASLFSLKVKAAQLADGKKCTGTAISCQGFALVVSGALDGKWQSTAADNCTSWPKP